MRASSIAFGLLLAVACGKRETPPALPQAEATPAPVEEAIEAPTRPTPAFVLPEQGSCMRAYQLVDGTCVHRLYQPGSEPALQTALAAYKRGVAPPMLGPALVASTPPRPQAKRPDPGALMRKSASAADAGMQKDQRLAELDAMLSLARAKLAKRDEDSKAKKVADAPSSARPRPESAPAERDGLDRFAQGLGAAPAAGAGGSGAGDPTQARMSELSRIASQLSGEQLQALTAELGKTGFNAGALEAILSEAREEPKSH